MLRVHQVEQGPHGVFRKALVGPDGDLGPEHVHPAQPGHSRRDRQLPAPDGEQIGVVRPLVGGGQRGGRSTRTSSPRPWRCSSRSGRHATTARSYNNVFVQGLLQTRAYAEAVIGNGRAFVAPINVDRMAELRMRRQQRLSEDGFQGLVAVMTESVIRTLVGGRDVMREQLRHLIEVTQEHPVTIHIVPFSAGALPGSDNFVIFEFPDDLDGDVVYVESDTAQRIYEDRHPVRQCTYTFDAVLAQALPARESQDLIRTVMEEL